MGIDIEQHKGKMKVTWDRIKTYALVFSLIYIFYLTGHIKVNSDSLVISWNISKFEDIDLKDISRE
jgi:hypothetical protein